MTRLVADVGGTNTRLALVRDGAILPGSAESYANAQWSDLYALIGGYLSGRASAPVSEMVIAVAGPVQGDRAMLTNRDWTIDAGHLMRTFSCARAILLNDLTALGYALPVLRGEQLRCLSPGTGRPTGLSQSLVVGIGTGFNVSPVLQTTQSVLCPAVEAGHVSLPRSVLQALEAKGCRSSLFTTVETLFSGRGLTGFCREVTGDATLDGAAAMAAFGTPGAERITDAITTYAALLGWLLRDLSLAYMPASGLYLAGSVGRAIAHTTPGPCLDILRRPFDLPMAGTPGVYTIEDDGAALLGCTGYSGDLIIDPT